MEQLEDLVAGFLFVSGAVLIVYFIARYTYLVKKMLAEKGILEGRSESRISKIDVAYVTLGLGIGLLISAGLSLVHMEEKTLNLLSWGIVLISGGLGLLLAVKQKG